jgi:anti-anti-sigma factor
MPQTSGLRGSIPYLAEAPSPGFQCTCRGMGFHSACVHVAGELDLSTSRLLEQTLRRAERRALLVLLDLRELTFTDSVGVHVIVNASVRARRAGCRLVLTSDNIAFCVLENILIEHEDCLVADGAPDEVIDAHVAFQTETEAEFTAAIER